MRKISVTTFDFARLLFMEIASRAEYESRKGETQLGVVSHNGWMARDDEDLSNEWEAGQLEAEEDPEANMAGDIRTHLAFETEDGPALSGQSAGALFLPAPIEEESLWKGLYESLRDVFFPTKLPPLQLTSEPIPVPDRLAVKPNPWAIGISTAVNITLLVILLFFVGKKIIDTVKERNLSATDIDVGEFVAPKAANAAGGGGGGGDHSIEDPIKGKLPKLEKDPAVPPQVQTVDNPKLAMDAAINVQQNIVLPDNPMLPNIGMKSSANVELDSNGSGSGGGMGSGSGGGMGSGTGNGYGPGYGGNTGGGLYRVGGGVSAPSVIFAPEAEFSDEARRAKYQGICLIAVIVDAQGNPVNPRVVRALGMGLDEKALEAVRKYKFKPAMKDSRTPVPVMINVEVNFRLY
jgi:TonB family protein